MTTYWCKRCEEITTLGGDCKCAPLQPGQSRALVSWNPSEEPTEEDVTDAFSFAREQRNLSEQKNAEMYGGTGVSEGQAAD